MSWNSYNEEWIWLFNEYQIHVDIVENYRLFLSMTGNEQTIPDKKFSDIYDTHPSIYERILEIEEKCINDTAIIELDEYNIDSTGLSIHF